ncbi:MAG: OmpA family protein [Leeuwenhoekiella sp.]|nr:OmpA family protein [Leeuwenhoekiella sp.]
MKKSTSILFLFFAVLIGVNSVFAQDANNPWYISVGVNAVDTYPVDEDNRPLTGGFLNEMYNVDDHWNILPSISTLYVGRYIGSGLAFGVRGSLNKIEKFGDVPANDLAYYAVDGMFSYSFRDALFGEGGWFDPYLGVGGGYVFVGDLSSHGTANGTVGLKIWLGESISLDLSTTYKHAFEDNYTKHMQHTAGIGFAFGGTDTDGDGIFDKNDECPDVPGLPEFNGCPDTDGDGIKDSEDSCPEVAGLPEFNGCPDTDGDGIADPDDKCPNVAGLPALNGCPDADGDGVTDAEDKCPNEAGPAANDGCPYQDKDNDGVLDKDDECPTVPGTVANNGCPEVTVEVLEEINVQVRTVLFDLNKATIRKESLETLNTVAGTMMEYPNTRFLIEGHTDSQGSDAYNLKLSDERAASVKNYLIEKGLPASRLSSEGFGETKPVANNATAAGRQQNRRVEISLID